VLPKSPIGKAISYALKNWKELCLFTQDGRIRIDNNRSEQTLRKRSTCLNANRHFQVSGVACPDPGWAPTSPP
jgi:hypothetical protein